MRNDLSALDTRVTNAINDGEILPTVKFNYAMGTYKSVGSGGVSVKNDTAISFSASYAGDGGTTATRTYEYVATLGNNQKLDYDMLPSGKGSAYYGSYAYQGLRLKIGDLTPIDIDLNSSKAGSFDLSQYKGETLTVMLRLTVNPYTTSCSIKINKLELTD